MESEACAETKLVSPVSTIILNMLYKEGAYNSKCRSRSKQRQSTPLRVLKNPKDPVNEIAA
jgi:hypothetical protein